MHARAGQYFSHGTASMSINDIVSITSIIDRARATRRRDGQTDFDEVLALSER